MPGWTWQNIINLSKVSFTRPQALTHLAAWLLVAWLLFDFFSGRMSVNPIQEITQRTGRYAIWFLVASLACTPLNSLFGWRQALTARRPLGLYAFMFAALHFLTLSGLDYAFNWKLLYNDLLDKRFAWIGLITGTILLLLALTSTKGWQRRLGKNWKRLHRLVYVASLLAVLHYAWALKGDIFRLKGNILMPLLAGALVIVLLLLRLSAVNKRMRSLRKR
jgi:methionine sulfoxide reductase heme-binding subunit